MPEVARLATTIIAIDDGRVVRHGTTANVLADPDAFPLMGRQEAGSVLTARIASHDTVDGLSELEFTGGRLITPLVNAGPGTRVRLRIRARDIVLALKPPEETSALNIIPAIVERIGQRDGAIADVALRCGADTILARITRRSLERLSLEPGKPCYVMLKSIAVARRGVGILASGD